MPFLTLYFHNIKVVKTVVNTLYLLSEETAITTPLEFNCTKIFMSSNCDLCGNVFTQKCQLLYNNNTHLVSSKGSTIWST